MATCLASDDAFQSPIIIISRLDSILKLRVILHFELTPVWSPCHAINDREKNEWNSKVSLTLFSWFPSHNHMCTINTHSIYMLLLPFPKFLLHRYLFFIAISLYLSLAIWLGECCTFSPSYTLKHILIIMNEWMH